jgi:hypothetical protein
LARLPLGESGTPLDLAAVLQAHPDDARHVVVSGGVGFRVHLEAISAAAIVTPSVRGPLCRTRTRDVPTGANGDARLYR